MEVGRTKILRKEIGRTKAFRNTGNVKISCSLLFIDYFITWVNHHTMSLNIIIQYIILVSWSSLINGVVQSNPGLCNSIQSYLASIRAFYRTAPLKYKIYKQCDCRRYKEFVEIEKLGFDVSFLKVSQLLLDDNIGSNPGRAKYTPKGRKAKKATFNFTM